MLVLILIKTNFNVLQYHAIVMLTTWTPSGGGGGVLKFLKWWEIYQLQLSFKGSSSIIAFNLCCGFQNIMTFNKCSINGKAYGDPVDDHGNPMDVTNVRSFGISNKMSPLTGKQLNSSFFGEKKPPKKAHACTSTHTCTHSSSDSNSHLATWLGRGRGP